MFLMPMAKLQSFSKSNKLPDLCICKNEPGHNPPGYIKDTITCTNNKPELIQCNKKKNLIPVKNDTCHEKHNRKKRSARHSFSYIPNNLVLPKRKKTAMEKVKIHV